MKLTFIGAAGTVTGSCTLVEADGQQFLIDCGMYQGETALEAKNAEPFPFDAAKLTAVFVTHAHLDHSGRLPMLIKQGFKGHIYTTPPTGELVKLILEDAAEVMYFDNRKFGRPILYNRDEDIARTMELVKPVEYRVKTSLPGLSFTLHDAGHIFGSAFIELESGGKRAVFSGDVGNVNVPILRDTENLPKQIDALVCESTYGDRHHETMADREALLKKVITEALARGGTVLIPSFALERTQELIYSLNDLIDRKHSLPRVQVYLDSPLAIDAIKVYRKYPKYYDEEADKYFKSGDDLFQFPGFTLTYTREESKRINNVAGPKIIIAGAGMMTGGRILHHALHHLANEHTTLLMIGYQSVGSLGRRIKEGQSPVEILGEKVSVRAKVVTIGALSAHADQSKLVSWISAGQPKHVYLNHGDAEASMALAKILEGKGIKTDLALTGKVVEV